ncbi:hypothetical protein AB0I84_50155 [Streptomyces spectabilis]|uniref:hypothetical protein n=1 Tax=Streptomyces spectabilis TaxID=68270 RepID=UPI0033C7F75A
MAAVVHRLAGPALLAHRDGIRAVYAAAFAEPPWHAEPAEMERLYAQAGRLLADHDARWGKP